VNILLGQQAAMILSPAPGIICLDFNDIHSHGCPYRSPGELCRTTPHDGTSQCHCSLVGFVSYWAKARIILSLLSKETNHRAT
jgi:hypothetical protein